MRTRLFLGVAAALAPVVVSSCSLTSSSPPDQNITEFCKDWGTAICQVGNGACDFDAKSCALYQTSVCTTYVGTLQGGTRAYSQANGAACIQALNDIYGGNPSQIPASSLLNEQAICARVVTGDQQTDQTCTTDADCATGLICAPAAVGSTSSVCATVTPKQIGDICGDPGDQCQGNSYCAAQGANQAALCVATPVTGGACSTNNPVIPCASDDFCNTDDICVTAGSPGDTCGANAECQSGYCDLNPPAACTNGLTFARGSDDCVAIAGASQPLDGG